VASDHPVSKDVVIPTRDDAPLVVVSDVHLGVVPQETERELRRFLAELRDSAAALLVNGDLFDVWLATRHFVVRRHVRVLAALADLVDDGIPVYFVGGNHDALEYGGHALREDIGIVTLEEPARIRFGTHRLIVVHGDGVRPGRSDYRKRHPILRNRTFRWVAQRVLHLDRIADVVARTSGTRAYVERHARGEDTGPKPAAPLLEAWARSTLSVEHDVDIALAGHSHLPACMTIEPGRYYVNSGDWISHMSYAMIPPNGAPRLETRSSSRPTMTLSSSTASV
jgi:UDP-2,3-diacylglucosamine hydrolase